MAFYRGVNRQQGDVFVFGHMFTADDQRRYHFEPSTPARHPSGHVRLTRHGPDVVVGVCEDEPGQFRELGRVPLGPEPVTMIRLAAYSTTTAEAVDLRITNLLVRAETPLQDSPAIQDESSEARSWRRLLLPLFILVAMSLVGLSRWYLSRHKVRGEGPLEKAFECDQSPSSKEVAPRILFRCFECGQSLSARPEAVGKMVKCSHCAKATQVPSASP
jgi:hypothetical protein